MLDLSGNNFSTFSLEGINGNYGKNVLSDIDLSDNKLYEVVLNDTRTITRLDLSNNDLSVFDYKEFDNMVDFDISGNKLETVNLAYFVLAKSVNISDNLLTEVKMPETYVMDRLDLRGNKFTIETLPLCPGIEGYEYAPQADIILPTRGPGADLSAQNRVIDGVGTTFTWKTADGTALPEGDVEDNGGKARFVNTSVGEIYCEMTNPAFPSSAATLLSAPRSSRQRECRPMSLRSSPQPPPVRLPPSRWLLPRRALPSISTGPVTDMISSNISSEPPTAALTPQPSRTPT